MKNLAIFGVSILVLLTACNSNQSNEENIQKLLDRQSEIQEEQEESLEQMEGLKDSLTMQRQTLLQQRTSKDQQIRQLRKDQEFLAEQLKEEEAKAVSSRRGELEERINAYKDSIEYVVSELSQLNSQLDSVEKNLNFYQLSETQTARTLESGIKEIDERMSNREVHKQQEIQKIGLLNRRILVAGKKVEAFQLEREMYEEERDELLRTSAAEEELLPYREKIAELDSVITAEEAHIQSMKSEIRQAEVFIRDTDALMEELQARIKQEYDKKEIIEEFIASERERLSSELNQLQSDRQRLMNEQTDISSNLNMTEQQIARMDRDLELISNKEMSEILEMQAEIEQAKASLAEEEVSMLEGSTSSTTSTALAEGDTSDSELRNLIGLSYELDSLNELIQQEKAEIARTRMDLAERRAEAAAKRAQFGKTIGITAVALIILGIGLLILFYYLGRRSRKS